MYRSPTRGHAGWQPLRQQLSEACTTDPFGDWPLIASLAAELPSIDHATELSGSPPFDRDAHPTFRSLIIELNRARACLGDRLGSRLQSAFEEVSTLASYSHATQAPPWEKLIEATRPLRASLLLGSAVVAGFDDALAAAELVADPGGYDRLGRRLDDLRAISELQGRGWSAVENTISRHLTAPDDPPAGEGEFGPGTAAEEILASLRSRLDPLPAEEEWAVWVGTLAGPGGANDRFPSLVSGPVAVCGLPCGEDVEHWLAEARDTLTVAFQEIGLDPPADVKALGQPMRFQDVEVLNAAELWASLAKPASFVARVAVSAQSREHAVRHAKTMIRALYSMEDPRVGRDVRSRARVWTPEGTWSSSSADATDRAEGEVYATQAGLRAAYVWARDLKTPLSNVEMERLAARSLIRDPDASLDVRLARAVTAVEGLRPRALKLDDVPFRLWYHDAWDRAHRLITNAVGAVSGLSVQWSLSDQAARHELNSLQGQMNTDAYRHSPKERLQLAQSAARLLHPEHPRRRFVEDSVAALNDRVRFSAERKAHSGAFDRARRHRNLVVHGHRLADAATAPSVEFLGRMLEVAINAEDARRRKTRTACLGSLADFPAVQRHNPQTFARCWTQYPRMHADRLSHATAGEERVLVLVGDVWRNRIMRAPGARLLSSTRKRATGHLIGDVGLVSPAGASRQRRPERVVKAPRRRPLAGRVLR